MRIYPEEATLPPGMTGAWHSDAHMTILPARLSPEQLVAAVFNLEPRPLLPGDSVKQRWGNSRWRPCAMTVMSLRSYC